jgi:septum formation topological specificity factor MinE
MLDEAKQRLQLLIRERREQRNVLEHLRMESELDWHVGRPEV